MAISVPNTLVPLYQNFNMQYMNRLLDLQAEKFVDRIAMRTNSTTREEHYPLIDRAPGRLRKWEGERQKQGLGLFDYVIRNSKYEGTINIKVEDIEDSQLAMAQIAATAMAEEAAMWPEQLVTATLEAGETVTTYDGQPFFSASHPLGDGSSTVQSNLFTGRPLTASNFAAVLQAGNALKGADGNPIGRRGRPTLVVPTGLEITARTILNAQMVAPTAGVGGGAANVMQSNILQGVADLIVDPWLTDATSWYILYTGNAFRPLIFQVRVAPTFQWLNQPSDSTVFWHDEVVYGVRARGNAGLGLWFFALKAKP